MSFLKKNNKSNFNFFKTLKNEANIEKDLFIYEQQ